MRRVIRRVQAQAWKSGSGGREEGYGAVVVSPHWHSDCPSLSEVPTLPQRLGVSQQSFLEVAHRAVDWHPQGRVSWWLGNAWVPSL